MVSKSLKRSLESALARAQGNMPRLWAGYRPPAFCFPCTTLVDFSVNRLPTFTNQPSLGKPGSRRVSNSMWRAQHHAHPLLKQPSVGWRVGTGPPGQAGPVPYPSASLSAGCGIMPTAHRTGEYQPCCKQPWRGCSHNYRLMEIPVSQNARL